MIWIAVFGGLHGQSIDCANNVAAATERWSEHFEEIEQAGAGLQREALAKLEASERVKSTSAAPNPFSMLRPKSLLRAR